MLEIDLFPHLLPSSNKLTSRPQIIFTSSSSCSSWRLAWRHPHQACLTPPGPTPGAGVAHQHQHVPERELQCLLSTLPTSSPCSCNLGCRGGQMRPDRAGRRHLDGHVIVGHFALSLIVHSQKIVMCNGPLKTEKEHKTFSLWIGTSFIFSPWKSIKVERPLDEPLGIMIVSVDRVLGALNLPSADAAWQTAPPRPPAALLGSSCHSRRYLGLNSSMLVSLVTPSLGMKLLVVPVPDPSIRINSSVSASASLADSLVAVVAVMSLPWTLTPLVAFVAVEYWPRNLNLTLSSSVAALLRTFERLDGIWNAEMVRLIESAPSVPFTPSCESHD